MMFSIIIPTYNRANLLKRCLQSLVDQTYKDFEVIVCDDGSTDNSKEITLKFKDILNIQYLWSENWGGPARPRNNGIKVSKGEWICFLDSDDWWTPDKLKACLPFLDNYDLLFHDLKIIHKLAKHNGKILKSRRLSSNIAKDLIVNGNTICNSSVVVRKDVINNVGFISEDKLLIAVEDFDYWIRIAQYTNKFYHIPSVLGYYWIGDNISISTKQIDRENYVYNKYKSILASNKDKKIAERTLYFRFARIYHQGGNFKEAISNYKKLINPHSSILLLIKSMIGIRLCILNIKY